MTYLALDDAEGAADAAWAAISAGATDSKMPLQAVLLGEEIAKAGHPEIARGIYEYLVENHAGNHDSAWAQKNICNMLIDAGGDAGLAAGLETLVKTQSKLLTKTQPVLSHELSVGGKWVMGVANSGWGLTYLGA